MQTDNWLPLTDYSTKYKISMSTLRRRIKSGSIRYRFDDGKYFVFDSPTVASSPSSEAHLEHPVSSPSRKQGNPVPTIPDDPSHSGATWKPSDDLGPRSAGAHSESFEFKQAFSKNQEQEMRSSEEPIISTASKLLNELKKAYSSILQEKEEQLIQLKSEVADLKTLVRVLEEDNDRMRSFLHPKKK